MRLFATFVSGVVIALLTLNGALAVAAEIYSALRRDREVPLSACLLAIAVGSAVLLVARQLETGVTAVADRRRDVPTDTSPTATPPRRLSRERL